MRLQLVRDRFIFGQENRALRRHLDSVGPDTPIAEIVERCRVWESHEEINPGRVDNHEPSRPRSVFQVTQCVNNEQDETSTGFDVVENLMKRLSPSLVPEDSDTIDIEQFLGKLIPVGPVVEEAIRPTPEFQEVDDRASGNVA